jgi:hypothetical protein
LPYRFLALLFLCCGITAWIFALIMFIVNTVLNDPMTLGFGIIVGAAIGFQVAAWMLSSAGAATGTIAAVAAGAVMGGLALVGVLGIGTSVTGTALPIGAGIGFVSGVISGVAIGYGVERLLEQGLGKPLAISLACVTTAAGFSIGLCLAPGLITPLLTSTAVGVGILWALLAAYLPMQRKQRIANYRQYEQHLIKP